MSKAVLSGYFRRMRGCRTWHAKTASPMAAPHLCFFGKRSLFQTGFWEEIRRTVSVLFLVRSSSEAGGKLLRSKRLCP